VLIKETNAHPLQWKLGRITQLHPGPDKVVRVVSVKCNSSSGGSSGVAGWAVPTQNQTTYFFLIFILIFKFIN
jgi:hypothetical protein